MTSLHGNNCYRIMPRHVQPFAFWVWYLAFFSSLADVAFSIQYMDSIDIYEQWIDYVDSDIAERCDTAYEILLEIRDAGGEQAEFPEYLLGHSRVLRTQRPPSSLGSTNPVYVVPLNVLEINPTASFINDGLLIDFRRYTFPYLPDYIPFSSLAPDAVVVDTNSALAAFFVPSQADAWTLTNAPISLTAHFWSFSFVYGVPYGPYWHQDEIVGYCTPDTFQEVTMGDVFESLQPQPFWSVVHWPSESTVHNEQMTSHYFSSGPVRFDVPSPPESRDPVASDLGVSSVFAVRTNSFTVRSNPWLH